MKQIVYISGHLKTAVENGVQYGSSVANDLCAIDEIQVVQIENNSSNIWCRDFLPVKSSTGRYVQFKYQPAYMVGMKKYNDKFPDPEQLHQKLKLDCEPSNIILDGGAIEIHGRKGIVSDRVFRDNDGSVSEVYQALKKILELEQLIVIPQYPYDFTGHVDGLVRFIDENSVVVNDLEKELKETKRDKNSYRRQLIENWIYSFQSALVSAGLKLEYLPTSIPETNPTSSGEGIYTNFLLLDDLILMPIYSTQLALDQVNKMAADTLNKLYQRQVIPVDATELSKLGGMINCVTWTK